MKLIQILKFMLTVIIFTDNKGKFIDKILNDLNRISNKIFINIWVVNWGKTKLLIKDNIKITKNKKLRVYNCKLKTYDERYLKYLKKVKTRYVWNIGDDDRINYKNFHILENVINKNCSGITMSSSAFINKLNFKNNKNYKTKDIQLEKYIHLTGFISSQIINVEMLRKESILNNNYKTNLYPQLYLIFYMIINKGNWKWLQLDLVKNRINNYRYLDPKSILIRLDNEYKGYLTALKKWVKKDSHMYRLCYEKLYFGNIVSWINLSIRMNGKKKTYEIIKKNENLTVFSINTIITNFFLFLIPNKLLNLIRNITK